MITRLSLPGDGVRVRDAAATARAKPPAGNKTDGK